VHVQIDPRQGRGQPTSSEGEVPPPVFKGPSARRKGFAGLADQIPEDVRLETVWR
jgi:hypothetical protein